jgi:ABC-type transporter Mla subunit MlaD
MADRKDQAPDGSPDLFRGLFWPQALMESAGRAQAAAAAEALRKANGPVVAALEQQREAAEALARLADQMAAMAEHVARVAKQQRDLSQQLQAAMRPYQNYLDWLERAGKDRGA